MVALKNIGGVIREPVPAGAPGRVVKAPFLGPVEVLFEVDDFWHGRREVTVQVQPGEIAAIRT